MAEHGVGLGVGPLRVRCGGGVRKGGLLSRDLSKGWRGSRLVPGSVPPTAVWLQLYVIVLWVMGLEGTAGDILPPGGVGAASTESASAMCPACPPRASLMMSVIPNIQLSGVPGVGRTWGWARVPGGEKYVCATETPSVSSCPSSSSFRPLG